MAVDAVGELDADTDLVAAVVELLLDLRATHEVQFRDADARVDVRHAREPTRGQSSTLPGHLVERPECLDVQLHWGLASIAFTISTNSSRSGNA